MANKNSQPDIDPKTGKKFTSWEEQLKYTQEGVKAGTIVAEERAIKKGHYDYNTGTYIPDEVPVAEADVGLGAGASAEGGAVLTPPTVTPTPKPKPTTTSDEPIPVEPVEEPVEEPEVETLPEVEMPEFEKVAPGVDITPAPAYEKSPEQLAWEETYGGTVEDILAEGGRGIPEETQQLMIQQQFDMLKAREAEGLRLLRNDMERRGITNSGLLFSEEQKIRSTTTRALASSMTDIQIKSAFMKMASFENALGHAGQFLGYLSEQSQLAYAPKFATWQAEQQAKLIQYQANMDVYKIKLQNALAQKNMYIQQQIQSELNEEMHGYNVELAQMEIDAAKAAAKAEFGASIFGMILGGVSALFGA